MRDGWAANEQTAIPALITALILLGGAFAYFWNIHYSVKINEKGISYQYFPLHRGKHKIKWEEVKDCQVVKTPVIAALSGWNVHFSNEEFYSLNGRNGLDVTLKNGEKVFLGAKDVEKLAEIVEQVKVAE